MANSGCNGTMESLPFADGSFDVVFSRSPCNGFAGLAASPKGIKAYIKAARCWHLVTFGEKSLYELRSSFCTNDGFCACFSVYQGR